ncbi:CoA-transferase family III domain-containing protein, partial [Russula ochroleuca]
PLRGVRALDLTRILAGQTATILLAGVINVEKVKHGDATRPWSPPAATLSENAPKDTSHLPPESAYFHAVNRNKRSITVNFKKPKGLEILHNLSQKQTYLVENFLPGKLDSMGLGYPDCSAINDRLIYVSITG